MTRRSAAICLAVVAGLVLGGCGSDGAPPAADVAHGGTRMGFTANGVQVSIFLGTGARPTLITRFRPVKAGFHLYSAHLPVGGIEGLGQRTNVEPAGALRPAGKLRMSAPVHDLLIKPLHLTLPVYPDGPVTARLPVHRAAAGAARVSVSYAVCSNAVCYPPVRHHVVTLD